MKKLYSSLLAIALCGMTAGAATVNVAADGLKAAIDAAADGDVLVLTADQTMTGSRINFENSKSLTIKGENGVKIVRGEGNTGNLFFLVKNGNITFDGVTFDDNNVASTKAMLECTGGSLTVKNSKFINSITSDPTGLFKIKAKANLENVSVENCTMAEGRGNFLVGSGDKLTVSGTANYSLYVESTYAFSATNLTGNIALYVQTYTNGRTIVKGATEGFTLANAPEGYSLKAEGSNLVLSYNKIIVRNETTGTGYSSLTSALDAMTAPEEGQPETTVITVLESTDATKRVGPFGFPVSIKGQGEGVTISRTFGGALFITNGNNMSLENLTLDGANKGGKDYEIEANQNDKRLSLTDVKVINSGAAKGVFTVKDDNRILVLNNVTADVAEGKIGINLNGKLELSGNNNLPVLMANNGAKITVTGELTNTDPIAISYADGIAIVKDQVVVNGCTDPTKFKLVHDDLVLVAKDGNLVAGDSTSSSIDEIEATEAGIVNVYSLQGVVLKEGVEASKATEGLAPGLYIVGGKKIAVR